MSKVEVTCVLYTGYTGRSMDASDAEVRDTSRHLDTIGESRSSCG